MKSEIDALMKENEIDALLVTGDAFHNPAMVYLTGGGHVTHADLIKPQSQEAVLFCNAMERDEAAKTGLKIRSFSDYPYKDLLQETAGDEEKTMAARYRRMLTDLGITQGRVAVYGQVESGPLYATLEYLKQMLPRLHITGFVRDPILLPAMMTKDEQEIERIRKVGRITTEVVGRTADFLTSHAVRDSFLVKKDGQPLIIADVKRNIDLWLAELGAENPEGAIFAIGRDAGVPHSSGNPNDRLELGKTIVFDIFPCESGGGYFHDFTRTWSLGYASDEAMQLYEQVYGVYKTLVAELKIDTPFKHYQQRTCQLFEQQGHATILSDPKTEEGYVHSIGHGVGLRVHEMPFAGQNAGEKDVLAAGTVFAVEPGLYYPSRGMGFRVESTFATRADGSFENLSDFPFDFVLPVKG